MSKKAFDDIMTGIKEATEYLQGNKEGHKKHRVRVMDVDVRAVREKLGLTQDDFAKAFGVSAGTIRNWEQGRRKPEGPARVLLNVIRRNPEAVLRAIG